MKTKKSKFIVFVSLVLLVSGLVGYFAPQSHPIYDLKLISLDLQPAHVEQIKEALEKLMQNDASPIIQTLKPIEIDLPPAEAKTLIDEINSETRNIYNDVLETHTELVRSLSLASRFSTNMGVFQLLIAVTIMVATFFSEKRKKLDKISKRNLKR
jgi:hypothetical protein